METMTESALKIFQANYTYMYDIKILVHKFHEESLKDYGLTITDDGIDKTAQLFMDNHILLLAEKDKKVIGLIGGVAVPSSFSSKEIVGQEFMWYLEKDERRGSIGFRLLKAFEEECKARGAKKVIMIHMLNLNSEAMSKFYEKQGYIPMEKHYIKELL